MPGASNQRGVKGAHGGSVTPCTKLAGVRGFGPHLPPVEGPRMRWPEACLLVTGAASLLPASAIVAPAVRVAAMRQFQRTRSCTFMPTHQSRPLRSPATSRGSQKRVHLRRSVRAHHVVVSDCLLTAQAHAGLEHVGVGSSALPLIYSTLAGLSTGIGGFMCLPILGIAAAEVPVTAFAMALAAAAMITVSGFDMFYELVGEIGLKMTLLMSLSGAVTVQAAKTIGESVFATPQWPIESLAGTKRPGSEPRLLRVGLLTAVTLTLHNFPEGMAVAVGTMGSVHLGLKLAVAIALHNIPEGMAIALPLIMSKACSPLGAIGVAFASGLSEPVGALLTLLVLQNITPERVDFALAFVGGVMTAIAVCDLLPESLRLQRTAMTCAGFVTGTVAMGLSLRFLA